MRGRKMDSLFEQTGGIGLDRTALRGSLACERSLNLGCDINGDRRRCSFPAIPTVPRRTPVRQAGRYKPRQRCPDGACICTYARINDAAPWIPGRPLGGPGGADIKCNVGATRDAV